MSKLGWVFDWLNDIEHNLNDLPNQLEDRQQPSSTGNLFIIFGKAKEETPVISKWKAAFDGWQTDGQGTYRQGYESTDDSGSNTSGNGWCDYS